MPDPLFRFKNLSLTGVFFWVVLVTSIRVFSEWALLRYRVDLPVDQHYIRFYLENIYYFLILFLIVTLLLARITKAALTETMRTLAPFYPAVILPPFIDALLLKSNEGYHYCQPENFFWNIFSLSIVRGDASPGIIAEILMVILAVFGFVYLKTRSLFRAAIAVVLTDLVTVTLSTPSLFFGDRAYFFWDHFLPFYYFYPFLALVGLSLWSCQPAKLAAIAGNFRFVRAAAFAVAVLCGGLAHGALGHRIHGLNLFFAMSASFLVWQASVMWNDIFDLNIDKISNQDRPLAKGTVTAGDYHLGALLFSFSALSLAAVVNRWTLGLVAVCVLLAWVYSAPPLRLRKTLAGAAVIGLALSLAFLTGLHSASYLPADFPPAVWTFLILVFLYGFLIPLAKDLKDIHADQQNGVFNLFAYFGRRKAKLVYSALFFGIQLTAAVTAPAFTLPVLAISAAAAFIFYKTENLSFVYLAGVLNGCFVCWQMFGT